MEPQLVFGDCLEQMRTLPDRSIDMVLADLPYGITDNPWDSVIEISVLWGQFHRLCTGAVVLTATQPFSSQLVASNLRDFRYSLVWVKNMPTGHLDAKRKPLRKHEDILVFWRDRPPYNPQMSFGHAPYKTVRKSGSRASPNWGDREEAGSVTESGGARYPTTIFEFHCERGHHPTQEPVPLLETLVRTYTHPGARVLDCTMGSGSTGVACLRAGREFVGIESDPVYFKKAAARLEAERKLCFV